MELSKKQQMALCFAIEEHDYKEVLDSISSIYYSSYLSPLETIEVIREYLDFVKKEVSNLELKNIEGK
ncbi:hypothetical protein ACYSNR_14820 [Enterococcus sp. LJL128]|uniref:hypothetical protein n=1 Tax=Enterococcus sp. LJL51 TaxID=3416656 RepID=UPI003CED7DB8